MQSKEPTFFAVYGSLKRGYGNSHLLAGAHLVGTGETKPEYDMLSFGGYPGVINGQDKVQVEVYNVTSPDIVRSLDSLEGHPSFYEREKVLINLDSGESVVAWMYSIRKHKEYYSHPRYENKDSRGRLFWENPHKSRQYL
jgi:gamma-glutamylcyclotransferase (GGCT)/AIG2-like uncharacterized protein YtfP